MNKKELKNILKKEGFPIIYEWEDSPNFEYKEHFHKGKVSFFVIAGDIKMLFGDKEIYLKEGERLDVPVGKKHTAKAGKEGCSYIVGQEIKGDA